MALIIDHRERGWIKWFTDQQIQFKSMELALGDAMIQNKDGETVIIIERKSIRDLAASIIDGRWEEQKSRYKEHFGQKTCYCFIGGLDMLRNPQMEESRVWGALSNLTLINKISYVWFPTEYLSAMWLNKLLQKQIKIDNGYTQNKNVQDWRVRQATKIPKRGTNTTQIDVFISQLCCIPGISFKTAQAVANQWKTMNNFMKIDQNDLISFKIGNRRLSKKVVDNLMQYLIISDTTQNTIDSTQYEQSLDHISD